ncbi:unnamed protein product [Orchesella dallaii]|uniref:Secreted protein n=1 Tax=Orchesella dallaii TaxID=48710 RepID=A0ABP1Q7F4_9HEXA
MKYSIQFISFFLATSVFQFGDTKKAVNTGGLLPCPEEDAQVCIDCTCNPKKRGLNTCKPSDACPEPLKSVSEITKKDKGAICPYGETFSALCTLCECSGMGQDFCAMCFALPVRRGGQPEAVNNELPKNTDNKFTNYEINGWAVREVADEEEEEEEEKDEEENGEDADADEE